MAKRLYVGNVSFKATEDQLREFFANVGEVETIRMIVVPQTGQPKGFAFVEMATDEEARKAMAALNGKPFLGRDLRVSEARPAKPREERAGFRGAPGAAGNAGRDSGGF
jgi:cold-inducible RNA-binding protein